MKKFFLASIVALAMGFAFVSCNQKSDAPVDIKTDGTAVEVLTDIVTKAKADGANWTIDQWKYVFKQAAIAFKPLMVKMAELTDGLGGEGAAEKLAEEAGTEDLTFNLLLRLIHIARNIITQGISLRQLIMLGIYLRTTKDTIEYDVLKTWIQRLEMGRMARLEGSLLMELFNFKESEIRFTDASTDRSTQKAVDDIFQLTEKNAADWYFTQGKSIFVRTSDSRAMMWHVKQSARYMRYYPAEAVTNFMRNFAHSLSHIEE